MPELPGIARGAIALLIPLLGPAAALAAAPADELGWRAATRDVYLDGELRRDVQVITSREPELLAVLAPAFEAVPVVDFESAGLAAMQRGAFQLSTDGAEATSAAPEPGEPEGSWARVGPDGHLLLQWRGHSLLIAPHQGSGGEIETADVWDTVPLWRSLKDAYSPDPEAVAALAAVDRDVDLTVAFGTWCGDSRREVPALLATLEAADNPHLRLRLVSILRGFTEPLDFVRDQRLTNVPTVMVREGERELGRVVETAPSGKIEQDLVAILAGRPLPPAAPREGESTLLRGRYRYRGTGGEELGAEQWELYATEDGGRRLHCRVQLGGDSTEVWHTTDGAGETSFVEITRRDGRELSRSRHWLRDGRLSSTTRGNVTGIVKQTAELPAGSPLLLPATAGAGQAWIQLGRPAESFAAAGFRLHGAGQPAAGRLAELHFELLGREEITTPAGRFATRHLLRRVDGEVSEWWVDEEEGFAVRGRLPGLGVVELETLERVDGES